MLLLLLSTLAFGGELRFAVTDFDAGSTDPAYAHLGEGLQSMLATDLSQASQIEMVERDRMADLQRELDLGASGAVDPATAARLGALAGATHLLAGTVTIVGPTMRLDARLYAVESGTTVLATSVSGEKEAFFELEKDLAKQLLAAVDVTLAPRERAELARIHTADFAAFQAFSDGLDLADQQRFDEALERLAAATSADTRFDLASMSHKEVAALAAAERARADTVEQSTAELDRLDHLAAAGSEGEVVARLEELAAEGPLETRLTALHLLVEGLGFDPLRGGGFRELWEAEDQFAIARRSERAARQYVALASDAWPRVIPAPVPGGTGHTPRLDTFDADVVAARARLFPAGGPTRSQLAPFAYFPDAAHVLAMPEAELTALWATFFERTRELRPEVTSRGMMSLSFGGMLTATLQLERSTRLLAPESVLRDDPAEIRMYAMYLERNSQLQAALSDDPHGYVREHLLSAWRGGGTRPPPSDKDLLRYRADTPDARWSIAHSRKWHHRDPVFIHGVRAWPLAGASLLQTSQRTDTWSAEGWRWSAARPSGSVMVMGDAPLGDRTLSFRLATRPPADWWPTSQRPESGVARAIPDQGLRWTVLFGLTDIHHGLVEGEGGRRSVPHRMGGWGVKVVDGDAVLVRLVDTSEGLQRYKSFGGDEIARKPLGRAVGPVSLSVDGTRVVLIVGGKKVSFTLPEPVRGFAGFAVAGEGFLAMDELTLE